MKRGLKLVTIVGLFIIALASLSSCTKSFCTVADKTQTMYYKGYAKEFDENKVATSYYGFGEEDETKKNVTYTINEKARTEGYLLPTAEFNTFIEAKIDGYIVEAKAYYEKIYSAEEMDKYYTKEYFYALALFGGSDKTDSEGKVDYTKNTLWYNFDMWVKEARAKDDLGIEKCPDNNYINGYKAQLNTYVANLTTCISPITDTYNGITIEGKKWKDAWNNGVIEGLLVYPIAWLIYTFATAFQTLGGFGTFLAIFFVTLIVRGVLIALTFKQTLAQQKMTLLQPELAKIQAKYPNAQTNDYEKQRLGQEQMALYKKYKINPFGMLIIMIFQFPIFIAVWGAMQGSSVLMSGEIFGLEFAASTGASLIAFKTLPWHAILTAWIIFVLMAAAQFLSMKLPQWLQKRREKQTPKLGKNPSVDQQQKTMKMVNNVMVVMIIVMGLSLPIAMSIYWFVSALISLGQSFLTQALIAKSGTMKNNKNVKQAAVKGMKK